MPAPTTHVPAALPAARARVWLVVAALAALQAALLLHTAWDKSDTFDEAEYLAASVLQWQGDWRTNCESPALPKWGFALALRLVDPALFDVQGPRGSHPLWSRALPQTRRNLLAARAATMALAIAAGVWLFLAGLRFGPAVGALAQALWVFSPTVLANGCLATLDVWAAAAAALALWLSLRLYERARSWRALGLGAALGAAAACKVTTLGLLPAALVLCVVAARRAYGASWRPAALRLALALAAGCLLALWSTYAFTVGRVDAVVPCGRAEMGLKTAIAAHLDLPFPAWIEGLVAQLGHGGAGHRGYLFGEVRLDGWWWFYLAALAFKTTLGAQGLALTHVTAQWRRIARHERSLDLALLAYPFVLLVAMSAGRVQNGVRYLLPAFPFAILWLARAWPAADRAFGRRGRLLVAGLVLMGTLESLRVHPHHLMFFNVWAGGPEGGPRYLVQGDDWGQDQRRVGEWQARRGLRWIYYARYGGQPGHWGIQFLPMPCEPTAGQYALHAVEVHRPWRLEPGCLDWLTVEAPDERLGYSVYIYDVDRARLARLQRERGHVKPFWQSGARGSSDDQVAPESTDRPR